MFVYLGITAFCILFEVVYAHFGHGVCSSYMTFMFLYPCVGGAALFGLFNLARRHPFPRFSYNAYNSGIATLTVGSSLHGVFDIAGTASSFVPIFFWLGAAFIAVALIGTLRRRPEAGGLTSHMTS